MKFSFLCSNQSKLIGGHPTLATGSISKPYKFDEGAKSETTKRSARYFPNQMNTVISDLPPEIISRILSLLPIEYILRCRAVCKAWNSLTKEPYFVDLQIKAEMHAQPYRTILIPNSNSIYLLDAVGGKAREISLTTIKTGRQRSDISVMSSCRGFLCLASGLEDVLVCNPITLEHAVLPRAPCRRSRTYYHVALGYDHSSGKYKVVKLHVDLFSGLTNVLILTLGDKKWRALDPTCRVIPLKTEFPRYCGDAIYWMIDQRFHNNDDEYILVLTLSDEKFHAISFSKCFRKPRHQLGYQGANNLHLLNGTDNTILLIEEECWSMHVWTLKKVRDEVCCYKYFLLDLHARWSVFSQPVLIETMGLYYLLEVSKFGIDEERDLVLYCPKSKQFIGPHFQGLPQRFRSFSFQPNFVAPIVLKTRSNRMVQPIRSSTAFLSDSNRFQKLL